MTKILGHRGARSECPENTMEAFKRAAELGSYGIETDVHLLYDGSLIIYHDNKFSDTKESIYRFDRQDLQARLPQMPSFEEVAAFCAHSGQFLNIEIKDESGFLTDVGEKVVGILEKYNLQNNCIVSCFRHHTLVKIKQNNPEFKTGALYRHRIKLDVIDYCIKNNIDAVHPYYTDVDKEFVDNCHDHGIAVNVWTVNQYEDIMNMLKIGVDIIMTDDVATARSAVEQYFK